MRRAAIIALVLIAAAVLPSAVSPESVAAAPVRTFTYSLSTKGAVEADVFEFAAIVTQVLNDPGGWALGGAVRFEAVPSGGEFQLILASPAAVDATSRVCTDDFSCRVGNQVLINDARWRLGAAPYTGSLAEYRSYVVSHEVGHWLGFGHARCGGPGQPAPIMVQQSKGLGGCAPTSLPSDAERRALAERLGITGEPYGSLDVLSVRGDEVRVAGWAIDPDDSTPVDVHVYIDDRGSAFVADASRPDVAAAHPAYGDRHGFDVAVPIEPGIHRVCVYAIDRSGFTNPSLGCAIVDHASPYGAIDIVAPDASNVRVAGWAIDPHTDEPIDVHLYVDGVGVAVRAGGMRDDLAFAFPGAGTAHGFDVSLPVAGSTTSVCAYAIDVGGGANRLLGCRTVTR